MLGVATGWTGTYACALTILALCTHASFSEALKNFSRVVRDCCLAYILLLCCPLLLLCCCSFAAAAALLSFQVLPAEQMFEDSRFWAECEEPEEEPPTF
jgi:hypothetical protein